MEPLTLAFLLSSYHHCFPMFVYLFGGISQPAHCYKANQTRLSALLRKHSAMLVPSVWISPFAPASVLWIAIKPFPSAAGAVAMPTFTFFIFFATNDAAASVKWLETYNTNVRNRKSLILVLLSAGFCCTCCSEFPVLLVQVPRFCFLSNFEFSQVLLRITSLNIYIIQM